MSSWQLLPQYKNKVIEYQHWSRNGVVIVRKEGFSTATFECVADSMPVIDMINRDGVELAHSTDYKWDLIELVSRDGGPWVSWLFPDSVTEEEKDRLTQLLDIGLYTALEEDGWVLDRTEYWFFGPLTIKEIK